MALTKVSTGVVDMSQDTGGLVIAKGTTAQKPTCDASILGSIRENTDENKVEVCTSTGWQFLEEAGPSFTPLTVSYLIIAGGGGGAVMIGGGGAGGYRNSYNNEISGGNSPSETPLTMSQGTAYTLQVGKGGTAIQITGIADASTDAMGTKGSNSALSGGDIATIESIGGGGGAYYTPGYGTTNTKYYGGSGGSMINFGGGEYAGQGTAGQGFNGGLSAASMPYYGGGGGGAGGAGSSSGGGVGLESSITGTPIFRGGGGGGGSYSYEFLPGGNGGGADGTKYNIFPYQGVATPGTGGGGGGGTAAASQTNGIKWGSNGASGIIILRFPASYNAPIITNSSNLSVTNSIDGQDRIMTYSCLQETSNATATITF